MKKTPSSGKSLISTDSIFVVCKGKGVGQGWALINFFCLSGGRLFEMGAHSRLGAYLNKYGIYVPVLYLPTFSGFSPCHHQGFQKCPATSADFRRLSEDFRTLPKMFRRRLSTSEVILETTILACFNFVRTQKSTPSKSSFNAFLDWIFIIYHFLRNALSGFVSQA